VQVEDATRTIQICLTPAGTAVLGSLVTSLLAGLLMALILLGRRQGPLHGDGDLAAFRQEMSTAAGMLVAMEARVTDLQSRHLQQTDRLFLSSRHSLWASSLLGIPELGICHACMEGCALERQIVERVSTYTINLTLLA